MTTRIATTPFGGGRFSIALFQAQETLRTKREALKKADQPGTNQTGTVNKWQLLRALTEARHVYGLSDRTIAVLEALMSFHPEKDLDGRQDLIVFPSNHELSLRSRGMAAPTLRRHIAALVHAGLLLRKDSANGKRFARKGAGGAVEEAFGFNLAPVALMAPEIFQRAEEVRAHVAAVRKVRGEITLHLRDIAKTIAAAYEDGLGTSEPDLWAGFAERLAGLSGKVSRHAALEAHRIRAEKLVRLRAEVESAFLAGMKEEDLNAADEAYEREEARKYNYVKQNMSGNDARTERHIQNSNKDTSFEKSLEKTEAAAISDLTGKQSNIANEAEAKPTQSGRGESEQVSLSELKRACPDFCDYAVNGLNNWHDARTAAELARPMLGISADAWAKAVSAMGLAGATIAIAYLIERATEIKSAGGYLRALTGKAEAGRFRVRPMLDSLRNRG
ncbi:plasmid replication protein RepC [uncultured Roseibium sp.]|uniref:plasmid replication protein RepC n=1 Tax=uncultured Roseibium sp. TaxID=1936171 RepID=UPI0032167E50